jgi:uncharacterized membrane protein YphA (DoxX/SURF4 family)
MGFAERTALAVPPIFLRLALAITFLWAGFGKVLATFDVEGEAAARLANMGLQLATGTGAAPAPEPSDLETPEGDAQTTLPAPLGPGMTEPAFVLAQGTTPLYTAADFPVPQPVRRLYGLSLLIESSAFPEPGEDGTTPDSIWPAWGAEGPWPIVLAWAAALAEVLAGLFLLFGFMTRFSGLTVAGVMVVAMWLTEIGPALQAGDTKLGFLPNREVFDTAAWRSLLWQFALFCSGMAVVFSGAGALALDRMGRRKRRDEDDDDE